MSDKLDLIDRAAFLNAPEMIMDFKIMGGYSSFFEAFRDGINQTINHIKDAPTIDPVHAAGVCYCRECSHSNLRNDMGEDFYECPLNGVTVFCNGGHFCGSGELSVE